MTRCCRLAASFLVPWLLASCESQAQLVTNVFGTTRFGTVRAVAFSPDGREIAVAGSDSRVYIVDALNGRELRAIQMSGMVVEQLVFNGRGDRLAAGSQTGIRVLNPADGGVVSRLSGQMFGLDFSRDGKALAISGPDLVIRILDAVDLHTLARLGGFTAMARQLSFSPGGDRIAAIAGTRAVVCDTVDGPNRKVIELKGHQGDVSAIVMSPTGNRIATAGEDMTVVLWKAGDNSKVVVGKEHQGPVTVLAVSGDGRMLASASTDKTIILRNMQTGEVLYRIQTVNHDVVAMALNPDATCLAYGARGQGDSFRMLRLVPENLAAGLKVNEDIDGMKAAYLTRAEKAVIAELNLARGDPRKYIEHVKAYRARHREGNTFADPDGRLFTSQEGLSAVDEAIAFLMKVSPCVALTPSRGLSLAARDHVRDAGPRGALEHEGSDGSTSGQRMNRHGQWLRTCGENIAFGIDDPRSIVVQLIIDDGVQDRGHRMNIFNNAFRTVGVSIGPHKQYGTMCVMDFAGGYQNK